MPYKLNVDLPAVNAGYDYAVLTGKTDIFPYENGRKVSDVREGGKLTLALQGARLAPLAVKFDHDPLPNLTDEQIDVLAGIAISSMCSFQIVLSICTPAETAASV